MMIFLKNSTYYCCNYFYLKTSIYTFAFLLHILRKNTKMNLCSDEKTRKNRLKKSVCDLKKNRIKAEISLQLPVFCLFSWIRLPFFDFPHQLP